MKSNLFAAALAALPIATGAASAQMSPRPPMLPEGTILDVSAQGRTTRVPDIATIRAGVVTQAATANGALSDNAERMTRVIAALKRAGVAARDIQTAAVSLSRQYRYTDGQAPTITGYQATNSVSVRFRDIARSGAILDALVSVGANQIDGPSLTLDQPDAALDEARVDAVRQARARADLYARAAGLSVVRIVSIAEGGASDGPAPMPMAFMRAKADSTPVVAGETDVTASITVRFLLK